MLGATEEPNLRREGVHDDEKISVIVSFFAMVSFFTLCFDGSIQKGIHSIEHPKFNIGACVKISAWCFLPALKQQRFSFVYNIATFVNERKTKSAFDVPGGG